MRVLRPASARQMDVGLILLRVTAGVIFLAHGAQKLFMVGLDGITAGFGQIGIPLAGIAGPVVSFAEFLGGAALLVGFFTRPVAAGLAGIMLGAVFFAHLPGGFFLPNGYEFVLTLFGVNATLVITGAGRYSVDGVLARRVEQPGAKDQLRQAA